MFDGIHSVITTVSGDTSAALSDILNVLESSATLAGSQQCQLDGFSSQVCDQAMIRLRFRTACTEKDEIASVASGILKGIEAVWTP
jgi:hypothetical protein